MVMAIGEPEDGTPTAIYKNHTNCVIFACKGGRSLPSMLAGGDLDGDEYLLITDGRLHPPKEYEPLAYGASQLVELNRDATIDDVANFVVNYINNDILGLIATQQLIMADKSEGLLTDANCLILAGRYFVATLYGIALRVI
jgi:RNA-dependent RNA polymerase